ncbi:MAG: hypothetical protein ACR2NZ_19595 [Rubripirellula sp.]
MKLFSPCLVTICFFASSTSILAQEAVAVPSAEQVFEKCAKACGGVEAINGIKSVAITGEATIPEFGLKGEVIANYRNGDLNIVADFNGTKTIQGVTNGQGWELSPTAGARLMSDSETEQLLEAMTLRTYADPKSVYASMENTGTAKVDDTECYRVKLVRKIDDSAEEVLFSVATGLPVRSTGIRKTELGDVKIVTTMGDYKAFGGLTIPTKTVSQLQSIGVTYSANTKSVIYNQPIPDSAFALPDSISDLLKAKK